MSCQSSSLFTVLSLLKIRNIALIDALEIEFGEGLNLLTGETGSGKSIIVDSLSALTGERVSNDLIKEGEDAAQIEGLFTVKAHPTVIKLLDESGIEIDSGDDIELIVRRELSLSGKNRVFVNNQLVTQGFLKTLGVHLADIQGAVDVRVQRGEVSLKPGAPIVAPVTIETTHGAIHLEVRESNQAAIALYRKAGFYVSGRRPAYYQNPTEAGIVMTAQK